MIAATFLSSLAHAADEPNYSHELEGFAYPNPVKQYQFTSQGTALHRANMDVLPTGAAKGRTAVILHDKKTSAAPRGTRQSN